MSARPARAAGDGSLACRPIPTQPLARLAARSCLMGRGAVVSVGLSGRVAPAVVGRVMTVARFGSVGLWWSVVSRRRLGLLGRLALGRRAGLVGWTGCGRAISLRRRCLVAIADPHGMDGDGWAGDSARDRLRWRWNRLGRRWDRLRWWWDRLRWWWDRRRRVRRLRRLGHRVCDHDRDLARRGGRGGGRLRGRTRFDGRRRCRLGRGARCRLGRGARCRLARGARCRRGFGARWRRRRPAGGAGAARRRRFGRGRLHDGDGRARSGCDRRPGRSRDETESERDPDHDEVDDPECEDKAEALRGGHSVGSPFGRGRPVTSRPLRTMVAPRPIPAHPASAKIDGLDRLIAGGSTTCQALEQADPLRPEAKVHVRRGGDQAVGDRTASGHAVRPGEREMGSERFGSNVQPASVRAPSTAAASSASAVSPSRSPSQSARGRPFVGKAPAPPIETSNGSAAAAATMTAARAASTRSSRVGPMKRSVRWRPSSLTQRTSRPPPGTPAARTPSTSAATVAVVSGGSGTATNRRRPGRSAPGQRGRPAGAVTRPDRIALRLRAPRRSGPCAGPRAPDRGRASQAPRRSCPRAPCRSGRTARSRRAGAAGPDPGP